MHDLNETAATFMKSGHHESKPIGRPDRGKGSLIAAQLIAMKGRSPAVTWGV